MRKNRSLIAFTKRVAESDPPQTARLIETLSLDEAVDVIEALSPKVAEEVLKHVSSFLFTALFEELPIELSTELLKRMEGERSMRLLLSLSGEAREQFIEQLDEKRREEVRELLSYPEDSVGRLMSSTMLVISEQIKIRDAISRIREAAQKKPPPSYAYVVDSRNYLKGVMSMRDTLLADREASVESCMTPSDFSLDPFMEKEKAASLLATKRYFAAPVLNGEGKLLGVVRADKLFKDAQEESAQDIQQLFGVSKDETVFSSFGFSLRKRLPWLQVNLVTAFAAASVVALFEGIIAKITALAIFLPVVAGQGGNAGAQSLAVVMRGLVMPEIPSHRVRSVLLKESLLGAVNGLITGVITALIAWAWKANPYLGVVIGLGMIVNLIVAGFSGALIPLVMKRFGFDPAQSSNIILTTVTDVMGFFAFLSFAVLFQDLLI